ncbi:MAG: FKBP-type peptidyl-prolyl cis-trans isomerase [Fimbriiglobus sp.]
MDQNRFRPSVTSLEGREMPSVSPTEVFDAVAEAERSQNFLQGLLEKDLSILNVYTVAYLRDFLPTLSSTSLASADKLAEYQNILGEQIPANPELVGLQQQVAQERYKAEVNALWGFALTQRVGGIPLGTVRAPIAPDQPIPPTPPPVVPPPPTPPPIDTTTSAGMTDRIPDFNDPTFVARGDEGLKTRDIVTGEGSAARAGEDVRVFYTGWLAANGNQFDGNRERTPIVFGLRAPTPTSGGVIDGFRLGIEGMQPGGIRQIFIPSALGYGTEGFGTSIPPNSDLVFEVKLLASGPEGSFEDAG